MIRQAAKPRYSGRDGFDSQQRANDPLAGVGDGAAKGALAGDVSRQENERQKAAGSCWRACLAGDLRNDGRLVRVSLGSCVTVRRFLLAHERGVSPSSTLCGQHKQMLAERMAEG